MPTKKMEKSLKEKITKEVKESKPKSLTPKPRVKEEVKLNRAITKEQATIDLRKNKVYKKKFNTPGDNNNF